MTLKFKQTTLVTVDELITKLLTFPANAVVEVRDRDSDVSIKRDGIYLLEDKTGLTPKVVIIEVMD